MTNPQQSHPPSVATFQAALSPERVLTLQMIVLALLSGVIMFLAVAFILNKDKPQVLIGEGREMLVLIGACIAISCIAAHLLLSKFGMAVTAGQSLVTATSGTDATAEDRAFMRIQQLTILRFAPLEGAAMVGLVFYFIGAGTINLIWLVPFFVLSYFCFPTRPRIIAMYARMNGLDKQSSHAALHSS